MRRLGRNDFPHDTGALAPVPPGQGARVLVVLGSLMTVLATATVVPMLLFSELAIGAASLTPVTDERRATVTARELDDNSGSVCDRYRFELAMDDRTGTYAVCTSAPSADLAEGATTSVVTVPWKETVVPVSRIDEVRSEALFWLVTGLVLGGLGARMARSYHRLRHGGAELPHLEGVVERASETSVSLLVARDGGLLRIRLLPAIERHRLAERDVVQLWPSRLTRWRHRPAGPWVVPRGRRPASLFTHAWVSSSDVDSPLESLVRRDDSSPRAWTPPQTGPSDRDGVGYDTYDPARPPTLRERWRDRLLASRRRP